MQVTEGKGKLQGSARVGEQQLPPPEVDAGKGPVAARTVSWRLVHQGTCYLLCLHVLKRFSCSQITLNGFIVHSKQHSIWDQVRPPLQDPAVGVIRSGWRTYYLYQNSHAEIHINTLMLNKDDVRSRLSMEPVG